MYYPSFLRPFTFFKPLLIARGLYAIVLGTTNSMLTLIQHFKMAMNAWEVLQELMQNKITKLLLVVNIQTLIHIFSTNIVGRVVLLALIISPLE